MLFSFDNSHVIATPSKCGSTALERALDGYYQVNPRHRVDIQPGRRTLVIREPLRRYFSAYWHLSQSKGAWCYGCTGDEFFARVRDAKYTGPWIGAHTDHRMWTLTFCEMVDLFVPHNICRLEDGLKKVAGVPVPQRWPSGDPKRARALRQPIEITQETWSWLLEYTRNDWKEFYERDRVDVKSLFCIKTA